MTEVQFHTGLDDPLAYACRLLRKARARDARVVVPGDAALLDRLDVLLWTFEPHGFLPHAVLRGDAVPAARLADTPIWLADDPARAPHHEVLVNLGSEVCPGFEGVERLVELVGRDPQDVPAGRRRWQHGVGLRDVVTSTARVSALHALTLPRILRLVGQNALLAAALLVIAGASALVTMRVVLASRDVTVPSLVGRTLADAGALAHRDGLALRIEGRRHEAAVPAERVVSQEPPPGATLKAHRAVRVWVSLGPRRVTVPTVEGDSARTARIALEQAGVPLARVVEIPDAAPEGTVLVQRPPAGEADL